MFIICLSNLTKKHTGTDRYLPKLFNKKNTSRSHPIESVTTPDTATLIM